MSLQDAGVSATFSFCVGWGFFDEAALQVMFQIEAFADGFENQRRVGRGFSCLSLCPSLPSWERESICGAS